MEYLSKKKNHHPQSEGDYPAFFAYGRMSFSPCRMYSLHTKTDSFSCNLSNEK